MATGTLGQAALTAGTNATVYTVPATKTATISVTIANQNATIPVIVDLAVAATGTPAVSEYILKSVVIEAGAALEKSGLVMSENKLLVARSSNGNVSVNAYGYEA